RDVVLPAHHVPDLVPHVLLLQVVPFPGDVAVGGELLVAEILGGPLEQVLRRSPSVDLQVLVEERDALLGLIIDAHVIDDITHRSSLLTVGGARSECSVTDTATP